MNYKNKYIYILILILILVLLSQFVCSELNIVYALQDKHDKYHAENRKRH